MITAKQAAEYGGVVQSRIRQLCIAGKLEGAQKPGRDWFIPKDSVVNYFDNVKMGRPPKVRDD